jgi:VCBS repeat-containing protein/autotransporter passenger strand-loop-strand repeat protein/autotransporter-associated beta strand protein
MATIPVSSGHTSSGLTISNGDFLEVLSGGTAEFITVSSGGIQQVDAGGFASHTILSNGGSDTVLGTDRDAQVHGGGTIVVSAGGEIVTASVTGDGGSGMEIVSSGGIARGTTIGSAGFETVRSGGTEIYAKVHSGGELILSGGASYFATLTGISGTVSGIEFVSAGGTAYETYVSSGGKLFVSGSNSSAVNVLVQGGGGVVISNGAVVSGVDQPGGFNNLRGGTEIGVVLTTGAVFNLSAGTVSGIIVEGNGTTSGTLTISGGTATGVVIAGGSVEVQTGGSVSGAIEFSGAGGTLKLDTTTTGTVLGNTISGFEFGNSIDLTSVAFVSGATVTLNGSVLELTEGGKKYDLNLSTSQNFTGETFSASADAGSGTLITTNQPIHISGPSVANVQKDAFTTDTGTLTATDTAGGGVTWTVAGGTTPHAPNYSFAIDQFQVIKNGSAEFTDDFNSLTPPNFSDGQAGHYTVAGGTLANNGSQDELLGSHAALVNASNGTDGQIVYLNSDTSPGNPTDGLFSGTSFTVKGTFDLVMPTDPRSAYGIQLTDRNASDGHDSVRLVVTRNIYNQVLVQLQEINSTTGSTDFLQSIALAPSAGDDRIELDLSNNGAINNGSITASFTLLNGNTVDSTTTFSQNGLVFVPENGVAQDWTQASFLALAPALSDSIATGTYGTLDIEQNGTWGYGLNDSLPGVQSLTQQQFATDTFQVQAADTHGNSTTTPFTAVVQGDSPTLSVAISGVVGQGAAANGTNGFNQFLAFGDSGIDSGYFLTHTFSNNPATQAQYLASVAAGGGIPTSLGGTMNSMLLAQDFGLTAIPLGEPGGTNYAASGATVRNSLSGSLAPSINSQFQSYLSSNGTANPNALYLVDGGGNDEKIADQLLPVAAQQYMVESANELAADLVQLHAAGAQYIVVKALGIGGADGSLGALFNYTLQQDLAAAGVPFVLEDFSTLIRAIDANPAAYGITNVVAPPVGPFTGSNAYNPVEGGADLDPDPSTYTKGWSLEATQLTSPNAGQTNLWSDDEHLSAAGQAIEANYIYNLVENAVPTVGETLTASPTLTGSNGSTANIAYQWQREFGSNVWSNISGATGSSYVVQAGDFGANLRVVASFTDPATGQLVTTNSPATFAAVAAPATWLPGVSGDWSTAADWTAGVVPASTSNVVLDNLTTSPNTITITVSSSESAQSLTLNDAGTTLVESGGTLTLAGALTIDAGRFVLQGGGVSAAGGVFVEGAAPGGASGGELQVKDGGNLAGSIVDNGIVDYDITGAHSFAGSLLGGGTLVVEGGGHLVLDGTDTYSGGTIVSAGTLELATSAAAGTGGITLAAGGHSTLQIDGTLPADMPGNTISGFVPGDTVHLANVTFDSAGSITLGADNQLQITEGGKTYDLKLDPSQDFTGDTFHLLEAADHSTLITEIACYCRGTLIRTKTNEIPVEALSIGDRVLTASGALRPIRWIGRRSYGGRFIEGRNDILPICFKAGSIGEGTPGRDLWISPHHAMYFENAAGGVLIEAKDLVNGTTIIQAKAIDSVEYFHIELETHDVIVAEGALSETFVDDHSRGMFHNAYEYAALYPDRSASPARYCAPRLAGGYEVEAIRRQLAPLAGLVECQQPSAAGELRSSVDRIDARRIEGWVQNVDHPEVPVCLDIYANGRLIGRTLANLYREDLRHAGLGSGRHAFAFVSDADWEAGKVEVRRSIDDALLFPKASFKKAEVIGDMPGAA